jgi:hypothetical protein
MSPYLWIRLDSQARLYTASCQAVALSKIAELPVGGHKRNVGAPIFLIRRQYSS